jgi:biopolymer transport protein ExbD
MRHRHGKISNPFIDPDLPIVPMLDMSFQLMAFFLIVFNPVDPEGHLDLSLPKQTGGLSTSIPSFEQQDEDELTVKVEATPGGGIAAIKVETKESADATVLGTEQEALLAYLQKRSQEKKPGKLRLEMGENLQYNAVVALIDLCSRAGYKQVSPALLGSGAAEKK